MTRAFYWFISWFGWKGPSRWHYCRVCRECKSRTFPFCCPACGSHSEASGAVRFAVSGAGVLVEETRFDSRSDQVQWELNVLERQISEFKQELDRAQANCDRPN